VPKTAAVGESNNSKASSSNRENMASMRRTAANLQMALPKQRVPMGSLMDKGIPFDTSDPKELAEARKLCRLYARTHDLVPLLIDIYAKFPVIGLEFECFAAETPVITSEGIREIGELAGGIHKILTTGGKWVEVPFKNFGKKPLMRVVVQRNGRQREFFATPNHRWFVEEHHKPKKGRSQGGWSSLTWDTVDEMRELYSQGWRQVDLGKKFNVSQVMVSKIVNQKSWTEQQRQEEGSRPESGWHKVEVLTKNLASGMKLVSSYGRNVIGQTNPSPFGIAHGMVFGDGYRKSSGGGCSITLYGEKDANLLPYFAGCTRANYSKEGQTQGIALTDMPRHFKDRPQLDEGASYLYGWLAGYFAADGTVSKKGEVFLDSSSYGNIEHARTVCQILGIKTSDPYVVVATGKEAVFPQGHAFTRDADYYRLRITAESLTEKFFCIPEHRARWEKNLGRKSRDSWTIVSVDETDREEEVYCPIVPETEAFTLDGNILTGNSKDSLIENFYSEMFLNDLNYDEFLPNCLGREYFTVGEATSLAHFNESLGVWSSEEIIDPEMIRVSKSIFVDEERVQLLVKDMIERLRQGPQGMPESEESPSERMERVWQYQQLIKNYPEFVRAADQDDGLDISDALVSRLVHRASPWDLRGTPHLMRSFRTLMMEESLNAAQDAVADRLYAPMILATLGMDNLGDGEPWIPSQADLDQVRDDMQSALAADFKLMVHNMGLKIESVFGRESVPRFDQDYDRITAKLLQAWGIGEALIAGGSGGAYASSALNREVCEQLMLQFQNKVKRHIVKRMEVIAEAQEHYDYEQKGGYRRPLYREIVQYNEETGEEEIVRVPKLLIPSVQFATLNLRDEATERAFVQQLKAAGVPVSDKMMAINLPIDFKRELERSAEETVQKGLATSQAMDKLQKLCDAQGLPYPPELAEQLSATLTLRQGLAQTEMVEGQTEMMEMQMKQAMPAAQMGVLPGAPGYQAPQVVPGPGEEGEGQPGIPYGTPPELMAPATNGTPIPEPSEIPRNRQRPEESDEMRAGAPRAANKSRLENGPSSYGRSRYANRDRIKKAVRRLEAIQTHKAGKRVEDLVNDPDFYDALHAQQYEDQIRADYPEILNGGAPQSKRILEDLLEQYAETFGYYPEW
jgi:hypothetical protein